MWALCSSLMLFDVIVFPFLYQRCVEYRPLESKHVTIFDIPRKALSLQKQVTYREYNVVPSNSGHIGEKGL